TRFSRDWSSDVCSSDLEHFIEPLGASTDWGSYLIEPQSNDVVPFAQWSCRLGGDVIQPWALALGATATGAMIATAPTTAARSTALSLRMTWRALHPVGHGAMRRASAGARPGS